MDALEETSKSVSKTSSGFINTVFNFDNNTTNEMKNIVQYSIFIVIPLVILHHAIQRIIPEPNPNSSTIELTTEIVLQISAMFIGLMFIHRAIVYLPTWSGIKYQDLNIINVVPAILIIVLSMKSRLGGNPKRSKPHKTNDPDPASRAGNLV